MKVMTLRVVFERSVITGLRNEPEFRTNLTLQSTDLKPPNDHYIAVFVFAMEPGEHGNSSLRVLSTTVAGIQRFTTKRLHYQGIYVEPAPTPGGVLLETLRSHYRACEEDTKRRMMSIHGPLLPYWANHFPNGAGDLTDPPEFVIADPEIAELERLFNTPDSGEKADGENKEEEE
jgi:hypothetical protein